MRQINNPSAPVLLRQYGFSLIEMSIVLVIAALLIGGIMNAGSIMRASQVNNTLALYKDIGAAVSQYKQRYRALPGDSPTASAELGIATTNGNGDGLISAAESARVFTHLFTAGFIRSGSDGTLMSEYGRAYVADYTVAVAGGLCAAVVNTAPAPILQSVMLIANIPPEAAAELDEKLDDGVYNTGRVRASSTYTNLATVIGCISLPL